MTQRFSNSLLPSHYAQHATMVLPSPLRRKYLAGPDFDIHRRQMLEMRGHARKIRNFKLFFLLVCVPALLIQGRIAYKKHKAELAKPRPEYIPYPYLNKRYSKWPWGDGNHSLFHNPERNWVPGVGYEKDPPAQTDNN